MARMAVKVYSGPIKILRPEMQAWMRDPSEGVVKDLRRRGNTVMLVARSLVRVRTGRLKTLIRTQLNLKRPSIDVIAGRPRLTPYTMFEHDGTPPHVIVAKMRGRGKKRRQGMLRFTIGGKVVFRRKVYHPGTTGSQFLVKALPLAAG